jgi:hypothetical protein
MISRYKKSPLQKLQEAQNILIPKNPLLSFSFPPHLHPNPKNTKAENLETMPIEQIEVKPE